MRIQWRMAAAAFCLGLLGSGCVSISQVQTADTLGAGRFQVGLEPGVRATVVALPTTTPGDGTTSTLSPSPQLDVALRYGVTEHFDLGARIGTSLVEVQSKYMFTDPENTQMAVSLAPSLSGIIAGTGIVNFGYLNLGLPVLIGFKTHGGSELVLGPRLDVTRIFGGIQEDVASIYTVSAGASIGYALRVTEFFRLMPEVAVSYPFVGALTAPSFDGVASGLAGICTVQFKLGFLFGQGRPSQAAIRARHEE